MKNAVTVSSNGLATFRAKLDAMRRHADTTHVEDMAAHRDQIERRLVEYVHHRIDITLDALLGQE